MTERAQISVVWERSKRHGISLAEVTWGRVAVIRKGSSRYEIHTHVRGDEDQGYQGKYLTWRPTLREAKERASWAYLADLVGADDDYKEVER